MSCLKTENRTVVARKLGHRDTNNLKKNYNMKRLVRHQYSTLNKVLVLLRLWHTHIRFPKIWNIQL